MSEALTQPIAPPTPDTTPADELKLGKEFHKKERDKLVLDIVRNCLDDGYVGATKDWIIPLRVADQPSFELILDETIAYINNLKTSNLFPGYDESVVYQHLHNRFRMHLVAHGFEHHIKRYIVADPEKAAWLNTAPPPFWPLEELSWQLNRVGGFGKVKQGFFLSAEPPRKITSPFITHQRAMREKPWQYAEKVNQDLSGDKEVQAYRTILHPKHPTKDFEYLSYTFGLIEEIERQLPGTIEEYFTRYGTSLGSELPRAQAFALLQVLKDLQLLKPPAHHNDRSHVWGTIQVLRKLIVSQPGSLQRLLDSYKHYSITEEWWLWQKEVELAQIAAPPSNNVLKTITTATRTERDPAQLAAEVTNLRFSSSDELRHTAATYLNNHDIPSLFQLIKRTDGNLHTETGETRVSRVVRQRAKAEARAHEARAKWLRSQKTFVGNSLRTINQLAQIEPTSSSETTDSESVAVFIDTILATLEPLFANPGHPLYNAKIASAFRHQAEFNGVNWDSVAQLPEMRWIPHLRQPDFARKLLGMLEAQPLEAWQLLINIIDRYATNQLHHRPSVPTWLLAAEGITDPQIIKQALEAWKKALAELSTSPLEKEVTVETEAESPETSLFLILKQSINTANDNPAWRLSSRIKRAKEYLTFAKYYQNIRLRFKWPKNRPLLLPKQETVKEVIRYSARLLAAGSSFISLFTAAALLLDNMQNEELPPPMPTAVNLNGENTDQSVAQTLEQRSGGRVGNDYFVGTQPEFYDINTEGQPATTVFSRVEFMGAGLAAEDGFFIPTVVVDRLGGAWYNDETRPMESVLTLADAEAMIQEAPAEYLSDMLIYEPFGKASTIYPPDGYYIEHVFITDGDAPLISNTGEITWIQRNKDGSQIMLQRPSMVWLAVKPIGESDLPITFLNPDGTDPYVPNGPEVTFTNDFNYDQAMAINATIDDPALKQIHLELIQLIQQEVAKGGSDFNGASLAIERFVNEKYLPFIWANRNYGLKLQITNPDPAVKYPYLEIMDSSLFYYCNIGSLGSQEFFESVGLHAHATYGAPVRFYMTDSGAQVMAFTFGHAMNWIQLPNGRMLKVDFTPPVTDKTPAGDLAFLSQFPPPSTTYNHNFTQTLQEELYRLEESPPQPTDPSNLDTNNSSSEPTEAPADQGDQEAAPTKEPNPTESKRPRDSQDGTSSRDPAPSTERKQGLSTSEREQFSDLIKNYGFPAAAALVLILSMRELGFWYVDTRERRRLKNFFEAIPTDRSELDVEIATAGIYALSQVAKAENGPESAAQVYLTTDWLYERLTQVDTKLNHSLINWMRRLVTEEVAMDITDWTELSQQKENITLELLNRAINEPLLAAFVPAPHFKALMELKKKYQGKDLPATAVNEISPKIVAAIETGILLGYVDNVRSQLTMSGMQASLNERFRSYYPSLEQIPLPEPVAPEPFTLQSVFNTVEKQHLMLERLRQHAMDKPNIHPNRMKLIKMILGFNGQELTSMLKSLSEPDSFALAEELE